MRARILDLCSKRYVQIRIQTRASTFYAVAGRPIASAERPKLALQACTPCLHIPRRTDNAAWQYQVALEPTVHASHIAAVTKTAAVASRCGCSTAYIIHTVGALPDLHRVWRICGRREGR